MIQILVIKCLSPAYHSLGKMYLLKICTERSGNLAQLRRKLDFWRQSCTPLNTDLTSTPNAQYQTQFPRAMAIPEDIMFLSYWI